MSLLRTEFDVTCPCCGSTLVIDQGLQRVLLDEGHEGARHVGDGQHAPGEHHVLEVERHLGLDRERQRLLDLRLVGEGQRDRVHRGVLSGPRHRDRGGAARPLRVLRDERLEGRDARPQGGRTAALLLHPLAVATLEGRSAGRAFPDSRLDGVAAQVDGDETWHSAAPRGHQRTRQ